MNHIVRLTADLSAATNALLATAETIQAFRVHLDLDKFKGFDLDGSPRGWISTQDVLAWLTSIADAGRVA